MSTVLLVDDSPLDRVRMRTILTRTGYEVVELSRGAEAVARAREIRPHLVILDINLPDTDGHTLCRAIRADPECSGIPVLMLTIQGQAADVIAGLEAGADDYVAKDEAHEVILARIRKLIEYRQMATSWVLNEQLAQVGRLLAGIVHEIRSPLSVIRGNAELLKLINGTDQPTTPYVDAILRGTQLLQVRLEHLMSTVRRGGNNRVASEIGTLVREATDLFFRGTDVRRSQPKLVVDVPHRNLGALVDPGRVIQVLLNLIGNSFDALGQEGQVTIRADLDPIEPTLVAISVEDNGPGVPPHLLSRVFEPFFTTKTNGSGYGLYLASEIVREQGGTLRVENRDEGGARFTVRFPTVALSHHMSLPHG